MGSRDDDEKSAMIVFGFIAFILFAWVISGQIRESERREVYREIMDKHIQGTGSQK